MRYNAINFFFSVDQLPYGMEDQSQQQAVYSSYPDANENEQYNEPPFSTGQRGI